MIRLRLILIAESLIWSMFVIALLSFVVVDDVLVAGLFLDVVFMFLVDILFACFCYYFHHRNIF